jgi:hypothetical protein
LHYGPALTRLSPFCRTQLGLFTRAQAHSVDVSNDALWRLCNALLVERVSAKVFRLASAARTWEQSVLADCLDGGPRCVASHRTAAALHGFDGFEAGGVVEVLVPMEVRMRRRHVVVHHTRDLPDEDRTTVGVIPVTSIARTLIDLGAVVPANTVEEAYDGAERVAPGTRAVVERRYASLRAPGRNGIGAMTQIRARRERIERVPRSVLERRMQRILRHAGVPPAVSRYLLRLGDGRVVELDFAIVKHQLDLEVDGHGSHATRRQRADDNRRANDIADADWTIRRFTYEQVMNEPHKVAAAIRSAVASREKRV